MRLSSCTLANVTIEGYSPMKARIPRAKSLWLAAPCAAVILLSGCFHAAFYSGDGRFTDNGILAYSNRYVIDLGAIDLSTSGTYTYKLSGLPCARFTVGINVTEDKPNRLFGVVHYGASVRVHLQTAEGETVILEEGSLDSWTRSYGIGDRISHLYQRGETKEILLPGGGSRSELLGIKASGGWGSYFNSEFEKTYRLTLEVLVSEKSANRPARIALVGWDRP